jgi:hypothetical protein
MIFNPAIAIQPFFCSYNSGRSLYRAEKIAQLETGSPELTF